MNNIKTLIAIFLLVLASFQSYSQLDDSLSLLNAISTRYYNEMATMSGDSVFELRYKVRGFKDFDKDGSDELMIEVFADKLESDTYLFFIAGKNPKNPVYQAYLWTPVFFDNEEDDYYASGEVTVNNDQISIHERVGRNYTFESDTRIAYRNGDFAVIHYSQTNENTSGGNQYKTTVDFEKGIALKQVWIREGDVDVDSTIETRYKPLYATSIKEKPAPVHVNEKEFIIKNAAPWKGENDLSFTASSQWDSDNIYITIDVKDDTLIFSDAHKKEMDHVTCFMSMSDCSYSQMLNNACRDTSLLEFRFNLVSNNKNNMVFSNYSDTINHVLDYMVTYTCQYSHNSYTMKIVFPKVLLRQLSTGKTQFSYGTQIGFAILVSDTDNLKSKQRPVVMSTAQAHVSGPSSLGTLLIIDTAYNNFPTFSDWKIKKNTYVNAIR